ncbi:2-methyl-6-phytyl-1,4-hydroquinone methyltransferase [bacterium HR34]|nr:2-methyl-6-phytyl-1,4-hydroquinone methyltransferase [bacterium HR34]
MDKKLAQYLLYKTINDFNKIASEFSRTRLSNWDFISYFLKYVKHGDKVLDFGCGNGRLYHLLSKNKNIYYYGVDVSENLVKIAQNNLPTGESCQVKVMEDPLKLDFPDNFFDVVFSIAVFHHIPSKDFRNKILAEIKRLLKDNGFFVITVWNLRRKYRKTFIKNFILKLFGKWKFDLFDIFVPWKNSRGEVLCERYVHCFSKKELEKIVLENGFEILESGYMPSSKNRQNIYLVCKK